MWHRAKNMENIQLYTQIQPTGLGKIGIRVMADLANLSLSSNISEGPLP